jgi:DNA end-binding protein Ku
MGLRSIASASIALGLVRVPVRVHAAAESAESIKFNLFHASCNSRLKQQYVCTKDGEVVERDEQVKGHEFMKGHYVTFTAAEMEALEQQPTSTIAISEFVDKLPSLALIDRCYYLSPDKGADRGYRLLVAAMIETGLSAIGQYAARGKLYLVMLTVSNERLLMAQLHYAPEVRPIDDVEVADVEIGDQELQMAKQLTKRLRRRGAFDPRSYRDTTKDRLREQIQRKIDGQDVVAVPKVDEPEATVDLLEALRASVAAAGPAEPRRRPAARARQ